MNAVNCAEAVSRPEATSEPRNGAAAVSRRHSQRKENEINGPGDSAENR